MLGDEWFENGRYASADISIPILSTSKKRKQHETQ